jgi:hypothetical protein
MWITLAFLLGKRKKKERVYSKPNERPRQNKPDPSLPTPESRIESVAEGFIETYQRNQKQSDHLQREANRIQNRIGWIAGFSLAAASAAALFSIFTFRQISQQTTIAEQQSRPWLKIVDAVLDDQLPNEPVLEFSNPFGFIPEPLGMVSLRVDLVFQNVGKGVAQDISIQPNIVFDPQIERTTIDRIGNAEQSTCEGPTARMPQAFSWSAVFPDDKPVTASTGVIVPYRCGIRGM